MVLIVEDDEAILEALEELLEEEGYLVCGARDGASALAILRHGGVSLVLLDLHMPEMDGWEFRRRQLAEPPLAKIPVVGLTADVNAQIEGTVTIRKPFDFDELLRVVRQSRGESTLVE